MAQGEDTESKNQKPTGRKLRKAREQGQVSQSHELTAAISLVAAVACGALAMPWALSSVSDLWGAALHLTPRATVQGALALGTEALLALMALSAVVMVAAAAAGVLGSRMQTGSVFSVEPLKPQLQRLNPVANAKRVFSMRSVIMFVLLVIKLAVMALGVWLVFSHTLGDAVRMVLGGSGAALAVFSQAVLWLTVWGLVGFLVVGGIDLAYQRYQFSKDMAMSVRDIRQEHKEDEGDPLIKSARKRAGKEPSVRAGLDLVPMSSIVIEDDRGRAIAFYYSPRRHPQPLFVMRAAAALGNQVKQLASEHGTPVVVHSSLVAALWGKVSTGHAVPAEHAQAVADLARQLNPRVRA
jgi:type III secretion protein U